MITYDKKQLSNSFSRFAPLYNEHAIVQHEIGQRLLERCQLLRQPVKRVLDLGSGTGMFLKPLQKLFPKAHIIGVDLSLGMVEYAQKQRSLWQSWFEPSHNFVADMDALPFADNSIDLIFSNCVFQWSHHLPSLFSELKRCLTPDGSMFFSTFGPQTLHEIKQCWANIDSQQHVHDFVPLQSIGDTLLSCGFAQPVVDQECITLEYQSLSQLLKDLKNTGARNLSPKRQKGLTPPSSLKKLETLFAQELKKQGHFGCTYEVIYGHAIKPKTLNTDHNTFHVSVKHGTF